MKTKSLIISISVALTIFLLTGCSTLFPPTPQELAKQKATKQRLQQAQCNHADVLLADLTKPLNKRNYSLKPGVACHD